MVKDSRQRAHWRVVAYSIAMTIIGGLPIALSAIGLWNYMERGHVLSRTGERMHEARVWIYGLYILIGVSVIGHAVRYYRRHGRATE